MVSRRQQYSWWSRAVVGLLICCLCPCICLVHCIEYPEKRKEGQVGRGDRRPRGSKPKDIRAHQRRFISPLRHLTKSQSKCRLLSDLPTEIREVIWLECLSGFKFHLMLRNGHLCQVECISVEKICWSPMSCALKNEFGNGESGTPAPPERYFLSLLVSCYQM